uniref:Uncharacterized protein n=1 Tax=Panagrolaimus sp. PS1159 TaxID=55785 RepID=A0AC35G0I4_9BILA
MNIQAIIFTFVFVIGVLLILVSTQESAVKSEHRLNDKTITGLEWAGSIITAIGFIGLAYTFGEIIYRQRQKEINGHKRKWEKQIIERHEKSRAQTAATFTASPV